MIEESSLFMIVVTDHLAIFNNIYCKDKYTPITRVLHVANNRDDCIVVFVDTLSSYPKSKFDIKYIGETDTFCANIYDITKKQGWVTPFRLNVLTKTISVCECDF